MTRGYRSASMVDRRRTKHTLSKFFVFLLGCITPVINPCNPSFSRAVGLVDVMTNLPLLPVVRAVRALLLIHGSRHTLDPCPVLTMCCLHVWPCLFFVSSPLVFFFVKSARTGRLCTPVSTTTASPPTTRPARKSPRTRQEGFILVSAFVHNVRLVQRKLCLLHRVGAEHRRISVVV